MRNHFLERIKASIPPPDAPVYARDATGWLEVEKVLGAALPQDYKDFVSAYGSGLLCGYIRIFNPFDESPNFNLFSESERVLKSYSALRLEHPMRRPVGVFPNPCGIFPWGETTEGEHFYWMTNGTSGEWPVFAIDDSRDRCVIFGMGFSKFVDALLRDQVDLSFVMSSHSTSKSFVPRSIGVAS